MYRYVFTCYDEPKLPWRCSTQDNHWNFKSTYTYTDHMIYTHVCNILYANPIDLDMCYLLWRAQTPNTTQQTNMTTLNVQPHIYTQIRIYTHVCNNLYIEIQIDFDMFYLRWRAQTPNTRQHANMTTANMHPHIHLHVYHTIYIHIYTYYPIYRLYRYIDFTCYDELKLQRRSTPTWLPKIQIHVYIYMYIISYIYTYIHTIIYIDFIDI